MKAALSVMPSTLSRSKRWYVARNRRQSGPFGDLEIAAQASNDAIEPDDLIWRPGLLAWMRADEVPGLLIPPPLPEDAARRPDRVEAGASLRLVAADGEEVAAPPAALAQVPAQDEQIAEAARGDSGRASDGTESADASTELGTAEPASDKPSGTLEGSNFEKLRALLDAPQAPEKPPPSWPRNYSHLRSEISRRNGRLGAPGRRSRAERRARITKASGILLAGAAGSFICAAFYGSRIVDLGLPWLQALGMRIF